MCQKCAKNIPKMCQKCAKIRNLCLFSAIKSLVTWSIDKIIPVSIALLTMKIYLWLKLNVNIKNNLRQKTQQRLLIRMILVILKMNQWIMMVSTKTNKLHFIIFIYHYIDIKVYLLQF